MFGKTIQNKRKQRKIRFATHAKTRNRLISLVNFNGVKYISGDLEAYDIPVLQAIMDMLTYVGHSNLDLSKLLLYDYEGLYDIDMR